MVEISFILIYDSMYRNGGRREKMFISTGDSKKEYEVIDVVCVVEYYAKMVFCKSPAIDKMFDEIKERMKQQAIYLCADAVLNYKFEYVPFGTEGDAKVFAYGTAVRFL